MKVNRKLLLLGGLLAISLMVGCGGNPLNRQAISGTVTLDGKPLDQGSIEFRPTQGKGVISGAVIHDGQYDIEAEKGLPPGEYRVMIFSAIAPAAPANGGPPGSEPIQGGHLNLERIPPKFNVKTEQIVTVTDGGPNQFNYTIQAK